MGLEPLERDVLSLRYTLDGEVINTYAEIEQTLALKASTGYHIRCGALSKLDTWVKRRNKGGELSVEQQRDLARFMGAYLDYSRFQDNAPVSKKSATRKPRDIQEQIGVVVPADDRPLRHSDLSERAKRVLSKLGYETLGDISRATDTELSKHGFREIAIANIRRIAPYAGE